MACRHSSPTSKNKGVVKFAQRDVCHCQIPLTGPGHHFQHVIIDHVCSCQRGETIVMENINIIYICGVQERTIRSQADVCFCSSVEPPAACW